MCFYLLLAVGEPPLCMSCASLFAVKHAVEEARNEIGKGSEYVAMSKSILSVCLVQLLSATTASLSRWRDSEKSNAETVQEFIRSRVNTGFDSCKKRYHYWSVGLLYNFSEWAFHEQHVLFFFTDAPSTIEDTQLACLVESSQFTLWENCHL